MADSLTSNQLTPYDMGPWGEWYQRKVVDSLLLSIAETSLPVDPRVRKLAREAIGATDEPRSAPETTGSQLQEALDILAIALPGPRPWPTEGVESKLRIYRNMAVDRRRSLSSGTAPTVSDSGSAEAGHSSVKATEDRGCKFCSDGNPYQCAANAGHEGSACGCASSPVNRSEQPEVTK